MKEQESERLEKLPLDILKERLKWDNDMENFLVEKRKFVFQELQSIDGQLISIRADKNRLFEAMGHIVAREENEGMTGK